MHDAKFDTHSADTHCTEQPAHSQSTAALRAQQPAEVTGRHVNNSATLLASLSQFGSCKSSPVHIGALVATVVLFGVYLLLLQIRNSSAERSVTLSLACHGGSPTPNSKDLALGDPNVMFAGAFAGEVCFTVHLIACSYLVCGQCLVASLISCIMR